MPVYEEDNEKKKETENCGLISINRYRPNAQKQSEQFLSKRAFEFVKFRNK